MKVHRLYLHLCNRNVSKYNLFVVTIAFMARNLPHVFNVQVVDKDHSKPVVKICTDLF